jgi:hypothetical protein
VVDFEIANTLHTLVNSAAPQITLCVQYGFRDCLVAVAIADWLLGIEY